MNVLVPNNFLSLRETLIAKLSDLDPFLMRIEAEHSFGTLAKRDGYLNPKCIGNGQYVDGTTGAAIPREKSDQYHLKSAPHRDIGHSAQSYMTIALQELYKNETPQLERIGRYLEFLEADLADLPRMEKAYSLSLSPIRVVLEANRDMCKAFLEKRHHAEERKGGRDFY